MKRKSFFRWSTFVGSIIMLLGVLACGSTAAINEVDVLATARFQNLGGTLAAQAEEAMEPPIAVFGLPDAAERWVLERWDEKYGGVVMRIPTTYPTNTPLPTNTLVSTNTPLPTNTPPFTNTPEVVTATREPIYFARVKEWSQIYWSPSFNDPVLYQLQGMGIVEDSFVRVCHKRHSEGEVWVQIEFQETLYYILQSKLVPYGGWDWSEIGWGR